MRANLKKKIINPKHNNNKGNTKYFDRLEINTLQVKKILRLKNGSII